MIMTKFSFIAIGLMMVMTSCGSDKTEESAEYNYKNTFEDISLYSAISPTSIECYDDEEYDECEDIDMSAQVTYYTSDGNYIYVSRDEYGNISGHDINGNYISGYSDQFGNTTIHDMNGNYVYSYSGGYGNTTTHDMNGNYTYSYTDDYGNTSGHDMNGNYYSAYTDDFGYTTITSY